MKKVYIFLATIVMAATLSAETITLKMSNFQKTSFSSRGITITATDGTSSASTAMNGELRIYAGGTLTISTSVNNITAIDFELSDRGEQRLATLTSNVPTLTQSGSKKRRAGCILARQVRFYHSDRGRKSRFWHHAYQSRTI